MKERRKNERRRWGRKVTYPFIDSDGVLVTKSRRRKVDRRNAAQEEEIQEENSTSTPVAAGKKQPNNTSIDISDTRARELEEALKDDEPASSNIVSSIKDLEDEILDATNIDAVKNNKIEDIAEMDESAEIHIAPEDELPEPDLSIDKSEPEASIELSLKSKKHVVKGEKESCQVGRVTQAAISLYKANLYLAHMPKLRLKKVNSF